MTPVWNRELFQAVKENVSIPVFAVGGIRRPEEVREILARGEADMIGIGRPFYIEPELPRWFLASGAQGEAACENSNRCIVPQMLGMAGVCYNPSARERARNRTAVAD
jgi:2,4-dienoyl-CoA reductase-like NADH-dependent reductase (Old Yellow Enzyme family)